MPAPKNESQTARSPQNKGYAISVDDREAVLQPTGHALFEEAIRTGMEFRGVQGMALPAPIRTPSTFDDLGDGAKPAASRLGPVEGFIKSTISAAAPESIGMDAMEGVEEWRAEHPKADFISEAVGIGAPMALGVGVLPKLAVKIPMVGARYAGALARAAQIEGAFARGAVQEVVRLAPLEVGLIGAGAGVSVAEGDTKALSRTVSRAATDMALVGVTGGVLAKIPTMRPFSRIQRQGEERIQADIIHDYVIGDSTHARAKKLVALEQSPKWETLSEADQATVQEVKAQLKREIRQQVPHRGLQAPVERLTHGDSKVVSELFRVGKQPGGWTGYIAEPGKGEGRVSSATDWAEFKGRLDMDALPDWEVNTQFFRYIKADTDAGAQKIQRNIVENMTPVAPNLWMSKEVDGAYVMVKRLRGRAAPPTKPVTIKGRDVVGERWKHNFGNTAGEADYVLDDLESGPVGLLREGDRWVAMTSEGDEIGSFKTLNEAARAGEARYPGKGKGTEPIKDTSLSDMVFFRGRNPTIESQHGGIWGASSEDTARQFMTGFEPDAATNANLPGGVMEKFKLKPGAKILKAETKDDLIKKLWGVKELPEGDAFWDTLKIPQGQTALAKHAELDRAINTRLKAKGYDAAVLTDTMGSRTQQEILVINDRFVEPVVGEFKTAVKGRISPKAVNYAKKNDLFAGWKTDAPGIWEPEAAKYGGTLVEHAFKYREVPLLRGSLRDVPLAKDVDELVNKVFPASVVTGAERAPSRIAKALVGEAGAEDLAAAGEVFKEGAKTYAAPSLNRYTASPTASRLSSIARASFSKANAYAHDIFYGKPIVSAGGSAIKKIFQQRPEAVGGILPFIERLEAATGEEGAEQFTRAVVGGMSPKEAKAAGMNFHVVELLRKLDKVDGPLFKQTQAVYEAGGKRAIEPLKNHYMMVRGWRGDTRLDLHALKADGSRGAKVAIASGKTAAEAIKEAELLAKELAKDGKKIIFDRRGTYASTRELDGELAASIDWSHPDAQSARFIQASKIARSGTPGRFKARTDMGGYEGQLRPLTYKEIKDSVFHSVKGMMNTQSETLLRNIYLGDELLRLRASQGSLFGKAEFPQIAEALDRYINLSMGRPTAMTQQLNRAVDRVLAPMLGANSATKIAFGLNKAMFTLTLGALDLGFPVMNSMTWMQTVLPEVSMTLKAPKGSLMAYYDPLLVSGRKTGMSTMWQMSPLRIAVKAFKNMHAPDQILREHLRQATREAVLNPKFAEEFLGDSTTSALKALQKSDFVGMLDAVNSWLPGRSEEFSRLHSFTTGHMVGRDFFELEGERLFQFAKKFTERTMFNYGTMDRPAMITGPVGSLFGLFKNWSMHYLWNLGAYGKQGWQQNNWSPFLWSMAGTGMVAGGMGVPGYFVADGMSRVLTDKPLMQNLYAEWGDGADVAMYGLPALLDVATAGRADAPGADAVRDINGLLGVASLRRMRDTYEFAADAIDRWKLTGQWPWESQSGYDKFAMAFLPRTAQRGLQVLGQDVVRSMRTQNAIVDGLSATDSLMFTFFGFQPINMAKSFEVDSEKWKNNEAKKAEIQYLGDAIGEAITAGDHVTQSILWKQALERGVPLDSIARSSAANVQARTITAEQRRGHDPKNIQLQMDVMGEE